MWKILEEQYIERFKIFSAKKSRRTNPRTGEPFDFFLMEGLDWVSIIPITRDNQVVLVRQFRHGSDSFTLETPGGVVESGDSSPLQRAVIELKEETGYSAAKIEHLGTIHANPAMQSMKMHFYLGREAKEESAQSLDPGEDISVVLKPLEEVIDGLGTGEFSHGLIVAGFGLLMRKMKCEKISF